jgi:hypothetical protein
LAQHLHVVEQLFDRQSQTEGTTLGRVLHVLLLPHSVVQLDDRQQPGVILLTISFCVTSSIEQFEVKVFWYINVSDRKGYYQRFL